MTKVAPFWSIASLVSGSSEPSDFQVSLEDMISHAGRLVDGEFSHYSADGTPFNRGDVLFGKLRPYLAKYWLADREGTAGGDIHVYRPESDIDPRYLAYIVGSRNFVRFAEAASKGVKMPRVEWMALREYPVVQHEPGTQKAIADYLDRETNEIDVIIGKMDELAEILEIRRSALIRSEIADLAGVHERIPLHAIVRISSGDTIAAELIADSGDYPVYGGNGLRGYTDAFNQPEDRVLIGRQGALCGNVHIARSPFWASEHALVLYPQMQVDLRWLAYATRDLGLRRLSTAAAQPGITASGVGRELLPLISPDEQRRIADRLDEVTSKIDAMLAKVAELKSLLTERRSALITDVVTGRKKVA